MADQLQPRSLHVVTSTARRGAETFAVELVAELRRTGHEAAVVALAPSPLPDGLDVAALGASGLHPSTLAALRRRAREYDVVVAHGSTTLPACAIALVGAGRPFVYRNIGDPDWWVPSWSRTVRVRWALRRAERVVALWEQAAERLGQRHGLAASRVDVIPNGVDEARHPRRTPATRASARASLGLEPDVAVLAFVGALSPEKAPEMAVEVARRIPGCVLLVAGDGPLRGEIQDRSAGVDVRLLGQVADVHPVLVAADVLLLPSHTEGMAGVLLEAAFTGTPVVASAVGAVPEVIDDASLGRVVDQHESEAFVRAVEELLARDAREITETDSSRLHRFTMAAVAEQWEVTLRAAVRAGR